MREIIGIERGMNSLLYELNIEHHRLTPKEHSFTFKQYMFLFDLGELDTLDQKLSLFSHNRINLFDFHDIDYLNSGDQSAAAKLRQFLTDENLLARIDKIFLLTNPRHLGYVFNPISVYFCYDTKSALVAVVPEICNTFMERKAYLIEHNQSRAIACATFQKQFYISPFNKLSDELKFEIDLSSAGLNIQVTTIRDGEPILVATAQGNSLELTDANLVKCMFKYPLCNFFVTLGIHFHALLLWLKRVPYENKVKEPRV